MQIGFTGKTTNWSFILLAALIAGQVRADNHSEMQNAVAMESSICSLNADKTMNDVDEFYSKFKSGRRKTTTKRFIP